VVDCRCLDDPQFRDEFAMHGHGFYLDQLFVRPMHVRHVTRTDVISFQEATMMMGQQWL
jgi:hypothetical protein